MDNNTWAELLTQIQGGVSAREAALALGSTYGRVLYLTKKDPARAVEYQQALKDCRAVVLAGWAADQREKGCSVEDCPRPHRCRGLCGMHYGRWSKGRDDDRNLGPSDRITYKAQGMTCVITDCESPVRCRSLCALHYGRSLNRNQCPVCGNLKIYRSALCQDCHAAEARNAAQPRRCTGCGDEKPLHAFGQTRGVTGKSKRHAQCRECTAGHTDAMRKAKLMRQLRNDRVLRVIHEATEAGHRLSPLLRSVRTSAVVLGLDAETVLLRFLENGNKCEACGKTCGMSRQQRVHIDHCHKRGAFRGFLCRACNVVAGQFDDNTSKLQKLIHYLNLRGEGSIFAHIDT